jgi:anti-anti-sigma regulatory factor
MTAIMNVKIDTKERFTVIRPEEPVITANMTEELGNLLISFTKKDIPHIILNLAGVATIEKPAADGIVAVQQAFYDKNCSFVVCEMKEEVEACFETNGMLELMNTTPTESEAWDIVQMEEIERELLGDLNDSPE